MTLGVPLKKRKALFAIKPEVADGTAIALAGTDVLVEVEDLTSKFTRARNERRPMRRSFSKKASVPGKGSGEISGKVELVGGGAAGTKPPTARIWGALGYDEYVTKKLTTTGAMTGTMLPGEKITDSSGGTVEAYFIKFDSVANKMYYMLVSVDDFIASDTITGASSTATLTAHATPVVTALNYGYKHNADAPTGYTAAHYFGASTNGKRRIIFGSRGTGTISIEGAGLLPYLNFTLQGPATAPIDATMLTSLAITDIPPEPFVNAGVRIANVLTDIDTLSFDVGNDVAIRPSANATEGNRAAFLGDRNSKITIDPEEQLEADIAFWANYDTGAIGSFQAFCGSTECKRLAILIPKAQYDTLESADRDGNATLQVTLMTVGVDATGLDDDHIIAFF